MTLKTLDQKLQRISQGIDTRNDFIIADAKDADMAFGAMAPGPKRLAQNKDGDSQSCKCYKTLSQYHEQIREVIKQQVVDIMLLSASNLERLGIDEGLFKNSPITPAARANDTTDIWAVRGGSYANHPSRHFRTATLDHIKYGKTETDYNKPYTGADLGLYSVTFTNKLDQDYAALEAFHKFRLEAEAKKFRYFLEVFNPNVDPGFDPQKTGAFLNDSIIRCLAGVTKVGRPIFLKIPYNGPGPLEELVAYDSNLVVGILGGSSGTTLDAFQLIHDAQKYGAKVALFGRKINLSEHPLAFIQYMRRITDGEITPIEAVKAYHGDLARVNISPLRELKDDLILTENKLTY
ncbi:hypothetical protein QEH52_12600 [Coraliomargarita sp. SDUM461003]|uniref:Fructose-bisphosphate aldolase n=1 Tax=Thalassobacterium maritimum TaxID=3041265 RepID=A0ABU1AW96_9BACT|nr:hypothetical protein [Coraliomargarita sp. SDUM461003]MDQ8208356.1 hypothetical protein [Coraliomargarita sp. SDUM461003]